MAKVADDQARKQRAARIAQAETAASRQRNGDAADEDAGDDGKGQDEEAVLVDIDQVSLDFVVLGELHVYVLGSVQAAGLCSDQARHDLYKDHDADNAEGIGDTVADGSDRIARRLYGGGQSRRARQRSRHDTYRQRRLHIEEDDGRHADGGSDQDGDEADYYIVQRFDADAAEKVRARDQADRSYEAHQADLLDLVRYLVAEVAEDEGHYQHARRTEVESFYFNCSYEISRRDDEKDDHRSRHISVSSSVCLLILNILLCRRRSS